MLKFLILIAILARINICTLKFKYYNSRFKIRQGLFLRESIILCDNVAIVHTNKDREELEMFKLLLSISGVGAKAALSLLSISRINNLKYAIIMEDDKHLCRAPGIGKKTAGRIILELKDKIKKEDIMSGVDIQEGFEDLQPTVNANTVGEALGALLALGYSEKEAETALKQVDKTASLEDIIKDCLKVLMG